MDVSNASLYDGGSAAAEAVLMALARPGGRAEWSLPEASIPNTARPWPRIWRTSTCELLTVDVADGAVAPERLEAVVHDQTACVVVQHPNFFGCLEEVEAMADVAHRAGALLIVVVDPISLGLLKRPGDYGADIVVAEGQSLGIPMAFGGPYLGILACREALVRRMPGRLIGQTVDRRGKRCWVLTLQTREQHIRREKATSNICTNQALLALRAAVYLASMGPRGMRQVAELCLQKARYAAERLSAQAACCLAFDRPTLKEFTVRIAGRPVQEVVDTAAANGVFAGVPLGRWYPELADCLLVAVTERRTKEEIDRLATFLG